MTLTFDQKLKNYADLIIHVGLNLQPGQRLIVRAPVESAPLVRLAAAVAYKAGARLVDVLWSDDALTLARFEYAPRDSFAEFPSWQTDALLEAAKRGDALLSVDVKNPDLLADQDPELVSIATQTAEKHMLPVRNHTMRDEINWCVIAVPTPAWAAKIFPGQTPAAQLAELWEAIFTMSRADRPDPVAGWQEHIRQMTAKSDYLNHKQYVSLKYTGPGTDFLLGLPEGHIWKSAQSVSQGGITFTANIPTEEVFTLPHREQAEGVVSSSRPLNYQGVLIDNFSLTFANGRVVKVTAKKGETVLKKLIESDEGAGRLGEVALVPYSSPISKSGLLFYNTLFDENAASHIALGRAYRFSMHGGAAMTDEGFMARGGNYSLIHVDFMIGGAEMDVDGITKAGSVEPVMRRGEWTF